MEDAFIALMTPQSLVGLGLILLGAYLWFTKVRNEGAVGSEFKELIEQLQSQIIELKDELKEERDARKIAESEKNEALSSVGSLTTEIKFLKERYCSCRSGSISAIGNICLQFDVCQSN